MSTIDWTTTSVQSEESRPDPKPLAELTGFERDLLFTVARLEGTSPSGVVIKDELDDHYCEEVNQGRLYHNLRSLVDDGLLQVLPLDGRTKMYQLPDQTRDQLVAHLDWERECLTDESE